MRGMKNVTITVEDSVLDWARIEAARRGSSVSRMLGDFMAELMQREDAYERAYLAWRTDERSWQAAAAAPLNASERGARQARPKRLSGQSDAPTPRATGDQP